jgi:protein SCO1/2
MITSVHSLRFALIAVLLPWNPSGRGEDAPSTFQRAPVVVSRELALGELMPDVPLRSQDGGDLWLRDFRGQAVAITFFYSRCTAATFCPLVGRKFDTAQTLLSRMNAGGRCHLLSISLDPERDTPEMLSAYARGYQADAALWTFATGSEHDVQKLGDAVGLEYKRVGDRIDHNLRTVILDAGGHIRHILRGDSWTPQELVADLNATARQFR